MLTEIETTTIPTETPSVIPSETPKELSEVTRLRKEVKVLIETQAFYKAINAIIRKAKGKDCTQAILDHCKSVGYTKFSEANAKEIQIPRYGKAGFASYVTTNNNARIKDKQNRIKILQERELNAEKGNKEYPFEGGKVLMNYEIDRIQILYDSKPDEETRQGLKDHGFNWSPTNVAWQRQITSQAINTTNNIFKIRIEYTKLVDPTKAALGEIKKEREDRQTEIFKNRRLFWAFSNEQFEKNKTHLDEGDKYACIGSGGYLPKSELDAFLSDMSELNAWFNNRITETNNRDALIRYELANHEADYTGQIDDTLQALGEGFTAEEVNEVFKVKHSEV
ncbi:MAG: hypothetical protein IT245_06835 [Bacteroidia bacterium]|nr:hypothetical protein [Bacteroidia bacterium]